MIARIVKISKPHLSAVFAAESIVRAGGVWYHKILANFT